jgi:hypothetical protein
MKRRRFLQGLALVPPLLLGCESSVKLPSTPTTVSGKVILEDGSPVEGYVFIFSGNNYTAFAGGQVTFKEVFSTSKDGSFKTSIIIPSNTNATIFEVLGFANDPIGRENSDFKIFIESQNTFVPYAAVFAPRNGEVNTLNFQLRKR